MLQMYMNISFKAWLNQYKLNLDKRTQEKEYLKAHTNMDNFDLLSEDSYVNMDPEDAKSQKTMEEWEYHTEDDIECSDDEESYYEDDGSFQEDEDPDSSRMLKH